MEYINNNLFKATIFIFGLLLLLVPVLFFARRDRRMLKPYFDTLKALSIHFSGAISKPKTLFYDSPTFTGSFDGNKFSLMYYRPEGQPPNALHLKLYRKSTNSMRIFAHNIPSKVLFDKAVLTHDPELDRYNFYSSNPDEAKKYLVSHKDIIKRLPESGWSIPSIDRRSITVSANVNHIINAEEISKALKIMKELKA
jgi:hypothetical protein